MNQHMNELSAATRLAVQKHGLDLKPCELSLAVVLGVCEAVEHNDIRAELLDGFIDAVEDANVEYKIETHAPSNADMSGYLLAAVHEYKFDDADILNIFARALLMQLHRMSGENPALFSMNADTMLTGVGELVKERLLGMAGYTSPASMGGH